MSRRTVLLALVPAIVSVSSATAQDPPPTTPRPPEIFAAGEGIRSVVPDRATVLVSVESRARTPSEAGALNAQWNNAIRAAIAALGVPREDIATYGYNAYAMRHEPYGRDTSFVASNALRITLRRPEQLALLGRVIDTALAAGATHIAGVRYEARRTNEAEREAIAEAMADARSRAEAVARAAGGSLGELIQATTETMPGAVAIPTSGGEQDLAMMRRAAARMRAAPTTVTSGDIEVRQYVSARWRFVPGAR